MDSRFLEVALDASEVAAGFLKRSFRKKMPVRCKDKRHLVSDADVKAEELITSKISEIFPSHSIQSEELGCIDRESEYTWVIDPLDGTHNFLYGIPFYGVSVGLVEGDSPLLGVIVLPEFGETYHAVRGEGAFLNDERIRASKRPASEALMVYESQIHKDRERILKNIGRFSDSGFSIRIFGAAAATFAWIAVGRLDLYAIHSVKLHDIMAGCLIVEEAGGRATDFQGVPWNVHSKDILASNGVIHDEMLDILKDNKQ